MWSSFVITRIKRREIIAKTSDELIFQVPLPQETCKNQEIPKQSNGR